MSNKFQGQNKKNKLIESAITKIVRRVLKEKKVAINENSSQVWNKLKTSLFPYLEKKYKMDIGGGHLGNGITVWDRNREEHRDYMKILHIGEQGQITIYDKKLKSDPKVMALTQ